MPGFKKLCEGDVAHEMNERFRGVLQREHHESSLGRQDYSLPALDLNLVHVAAGIDISLPPTSACRTAYFRFNADHDFPRYWHLPSPLALPRPPPQDTATAYAK